MGCEERGARLRTGVSRSVLPVLAHANTGVSEVGEAELTLTLPPGAAEISLAGDTPVLSRVPHSSHLKLHPQKVYYYVVT